MPHVARHTGEKNVRVAALEPPHLGQGRNGLPLAQVFAQEEAVDLGRVPANHHILVVVGKNRRLCEPCRTQRRRQRARLPHVLQGVFPECLAILGVSLGDFARPEFHAVLLGDTKVPRRRLESETFQLSRADIVELHEKQRVHDVPSMDLEFAVLDQTLGDLQPRRMRPQRATVSPQLQLHPALPRARFEVGQVEFENIVPLDHIGIPLAHQRNEFLQHRFFLRFVRWIVHHENLLPPRTVTHRDRKQRITRRVGHRPIRARERLDIHLHPAQILEGHAFEQRPPAVQQVLVSEIIERKEFLFVLGFRFGKLPRAVKSHREAESALSGQLPRLPRQRLRGPSERLVLRFLDNRFVHLTPVNLHPVRRDKLNRHDPLGRVRPEKHGIVFDG